MSVSFKKFLVTSLAVWWFRRHLLMQGVRFNPGEGAKFPHAAGPKQPKQAIKWKQYCNKTNKHLKMVPNKKNTIKNQF